MNKKILYTPIDSLNVSAEFKIMAHANGLNNLDALLQHPLTQIPFLKFSGYRLLKELIDLLEQYHYPLPY